MKLKELVSRNVSAALREVANAEAVAKHSKEGTIPDKVIVDLQHTRLLLEDVAKELAGGVGAAQPLP